MSTRRYCRTCEDETLHDRETSIWAHGHHTRALERSFMALVTAGVSEAIAKRVFVCQCCGTRVER
jgi:hypothetical protein